MNYVQNLIDLICGKVDNTGKYISDGQVDMYIRDVMRPQGDVVNGGRYEINSSGRVVDNLSSGGKGRWKELSQLGPKYSKPAKDDGTTHLTKQTPSGGSVIPINNNPDYWPNIIDRLNTPFDHIDRILLQDLSVKEVMDIQGDDNYFKGIYGFTFRKNSTSSDAKYKDTYGITKFSITDEGSPANYSQLNSQFSSGEFFLDSFTYTPFVDFSLTGQKGDVKIGVYSDKFLTDYNVGRYNPGYSGDQARAQVDVNRRVLSSNLYQLRNLQKDVYEAQVSFRSAITYIDEEDKEKGYQTYIHVFCEHLASLFAKLSNIRMSHLVYGLKHPHHEWEGILALDIWYNLLYKNIDSNYPFDYTKFNMNPMVRKRVYQDSNGRYVQYDINDQGSPEEKRVYEDDAASFGLEWIDDDTVESDSEQYAFIWDENMWTYFNGKAHDIASHRRDYVQPRGVLEQMYQFIQLTNVQTSIISSFQNGDFPWFYQPGKVYSDSDKSVYSKYTNLHLGYAYERMSPEDYYLLMGNDISEIGDNRFYVKPGWSDLTDVQKRDVKKAMVEAGCKALQDAFLVMRNEHLFNIYNSRLNIVEMFRPSESRNYSQAQCAIVIERIFSRLYKYLQFKSTTGEIFQRHINIDTGYKYLTSESILNSENDASHVYYNEKDVNDGIPDYLRYLSRLEDYANDLSGIGTQAKLTATEMQLLKKFIAILMVKAFPWEKVPADAAAKQKNRWNLCPLCSDWTGDTTMYQLPALRKARSLMASRAVEDEDEGEDEPVRQRTVNIYYNTKNYMTWDTSHVVQPTGSSSDFTISSSGSTPLMLSRTTEVTDLNFNLNLSEISASIKKSPKYVSSNASRTTITYRLLGYSTNKDATVPTYGPNDELGSSVYPGTSTSIDLYAIWDSKVIVNFSRGEMRTTGSMAPIIVSTNIPTNVPANGFTPSGDLPTLKKFVYHESTSTPKLWTNNVSALNAASETVYNFQFDHWEYNILGAIREVGDRGSIMVDMGNGVPEITLVAKWTQGWNRIPFMVEDQLYCEVLVSAKNPVLSCPVDPLLVGKAFLGWDRVDGEVLSEVGKKEIAIVCYEPQLSTAGGRTKESKRTICKENPAGLHIVCIDESIGEYTEAVRARIAEDMVKNYGLTFKFLDEDGTAKIISQTVQENQHIPSFHIHSEVAKSNGTKLVFRYWKLESGDISSSMTILSDSVLVAVYDEVQPPPAEQTTQLPTEPQMPGVRDRRTEPQKLTGCPFWSNQGSAGVENKDGKYYCLINGLHPKEYGSQFSEFVNPECPFIKMLNKIKASTNDFASMTMLEIADVAYLIKALFKVNVDIAHREYYLRVDIPPVSEWWYGWKEGEDIGDGAQVVCDNTSTNVICSYDSKTQVVCNSNTQKWYSFEPTVEFKFSNLHASNQVENGRLICTVKSRSDTPSIVPINRELVDSNGIHYNDYYYYYDYYKSVQKVYQKNNSSDNNTTQLSIPLNDAQKYYEIRPLCLYENTGMQSPVDVNDFIRHRLSTINRSTKQIRTFTSIVKKYRPVIMPNVRDIFNDCIGAELKRDADINNDYGVFGWCTIPSKTMINMEYNEQAIIVPSTYDHHNRVGGSNFLQMDKDFEKVYEKWQGSKDDGGLIDNTKNTWYYLYNTRDWTYFLKPFFNINPNIELFSFMNDTYRAELRPLSSDHINGVLFERSNENRSADKAFGDIARSCQFLAKYHHNENNLKTLAERFTNLLNYDQFKQMTGQTVSGTFQFNSIYGSEYASIPKKFRFPFQDWIDDYDKTSSYVDLTVNKYKPGATTAGALKYKYNLGQAHAIDDFDEDSVWFYITMVSPIEDLEQVIELKDIMPFVFWWENRGRDNNGPVVDAYGHQSNAKLNYEKGGWCYSGAHERQDEAITATQHETIRTAFLETEHRWHAVQHTLGTDFSKKEYGGTILTTDNSGNVYKGAFDPNCAGTDEKWKIHHMSNAFGTEQHEDPLEDKYYHGEQTHGEGDFKNKVIPDQFNEKILQSISDRPMTWNLWNVVRHYAYFKYFKNRHRELGTDQAAWEDLENYTKKIVKGIYRTFVDQKYTNKTAKTRTLFGDALGGGVSTNSGTGACCIRWTNSFVEISTILERNARDHQASFVLFTGNVPTPSSLDTQGLVTNMVNKYDPNITGDPLLRRQMALGKYRYDTILQSADNFRVTTLDGVDDDYDGMRERERKNAANPYAGYQSPDEKVRAITPKVRIYQGFKYEDMPTTYVVGDTLTYNQRLADTIIRYDELLNLDFEYPESEYYLHDTTRKWVRRIMQTTMNRQIFPVYTSMETMDKSVHDVTVDELKSITFQVVPQFYWRYEWTYNDFMIHFVGRLNSPSKSLEMYDMIGNVWEWVRDDWSTTISSVIGTSGNPSINPIVGTKVEGGDADKKVIKGGAFDQFCRKTISSSREGLERNKCQSQFGTQPNVGFRPVLEYTVDGKNSAFDKRHTPVDLFFLFDASASQFSQISAMVRSAEEIVKMFAGDGPDAKNVCNVGSALFLGPKIKLMCSQQICSMKGYQFVRLPRPDPDGTSLCVDAGTSANQQRMREEYKIARQNTLAKKDPDGYQAGFECGQKEYPTKLSSSFKSKFNKYKEDWWKKAPVPPDFITRQVAMDNEEEPEIDTEEGWSDYGPDEDGISFVAMDKMDDSEPKVMLASRDATTGSSGTGGGNYGGCANYPAYMPGEAEHNMFGHRGVAVWLENGTLHYEDREGGVANHLYTFDPSEAAKDYFEVPWIQSNRGVLCNWWAGCEPVTKLVSNLLGSGFFHGFPYTPAIGYAFRKKDIPKLIFVYTNEFDNSIARKRTSDGHAVMAIPSVYGSTLKLSPFHSYQNAWYKDNGIGNIQYPPDPHCLKQAGMAAGIDAYLGGLGLLAANPARVSMNNAVATLATMFGSSIASVSNNMTVKPFKKDKKGDADLGIVSSSYKSGTIPTSFNSLKTVRDIMKRSPTSVFTYKADDKGLELKKILTDDQVSSLLNYRCFPGVNYAANNESTVNFNWALTQGFYELHKTVSGMSDPINTYLLVTNADAPELLKGTGAPLYIGKDFNLFDSIKSLVCKFDGEADAKAALEGIKEKIRKNQFFYNGGDISWKTVYASNIMYYGEKFYGKDGIPKVKEKAASAVETIFGLQNPKLGTQIVWGARHGGSTFNEKTYKNTRQGTWYVVGLPMTTGDGADRKIKTKKATKAEALAAFTAGSKWSISDWMNNTNRCRLNLGLSNGYIVLARIKDGEVKEIDDYGIDMLVSSESIRHDKDFFHLYSFGDYKNPYAFSNDFVMEDCVTIPHYNAAGAEVGVTKIICFVPLKRTDGETHNVFHSHALAKANDQYLKKAQGFWADVMNVIVADDRTDNYPTYWKGVIGACAIHQKMTYFSSGYALDAMWGSGGAGLQAVVRNLYNNLATALPALMGYRYKTEIFDRIKNNCGSGLSVTNYDDDENTMIFKPLPIVDFNGMEGLFEVSFGSGQFNSTRSFSYSHCIVDLNPNTADYAVEGAPALAAGKFPLEFASGVDVNADDTYKKSKIVLTRIPEISGQNWDTFKMGSQSKYYEKILDENRIKYSDDESILDAAPQDMVEVTLGNGGAYQKQYCNANLKKGITPAAGEPPYGYNSTKDLFAIQDPEHPTDAKKKKYFMNRHLFVDPFELTIAQWCHAHGKHTKTDAINYLVGWSRENLREMAKTFWKYLMIWEKELFKWYKDRNATYCNRSDGEYLNALYNDADKMCNESGYRASAAYNPLDDIRPFYYATYTSIRGTGKVYDNVPGTNGGNYVLAPGKGDEYQLCTNTTDSFMKILNTNVVTRTYPRQYKNDPTDGGQLYDYTKMESDAAAAGLVGVAKTKRWANGRAAGLNFDLPTEAQWEYVCRDGSIAAYPISHYLGGNFEEQEPGLDVIAWYKYKIIGKLPEPERFCTWRISKMLFGISKDKEMINNVYETTPD